MNIGERLKYLRNKSKKTLKDQSEVFGVSVNTIYRWEHDLAMPRKTVLKKITDYYEVPLEWLFQKETMEDTFYDMAQRRDNGLEQKLLKMYRKLSEGDRYKLLGYIERLHVEAMEKTEAEACRQLDEENNAY